MSKRYSGKSFKDSSVMKKPKLTFKEKRKLKEEKKKKRWKVVIDCAQIAPTSVPKNLWYNLNIMNVFIILSILIIVIGVLLLVATPSVFFKLNWKEKTGKEKILMFMFYSILVYIINIIYWIIKWTKKTQVNYWNEWKKKSNYRRNFCPSHSKS